MPKKTITIQSMCDTKTTAVAQTIKQIKQLEKEGCDLVRVAVPDLASAKALTKIKPQIKIPLIADIHFNPALALAAIENGADKIRINPGNIQDKKMLAEIAAAAKKRKIPIRIGVNSGSFSRQPTPGNLADEAIKWTEFFEDQKFKNLVISIKSSDPQTVIEANEILHTKLKRRKTPYPIHLGVTEAGTLITGITKSTIALASLLKKGIGNTIRISLTEDPVLEIKAAKELLKSLGLYTKEPLIISCPTCGRTEIDLKKLTKEIEKELAKVKFKPRTKPLKVAVMGCVVNGPGEAREADYAICGGRGQGAIYKKGKHLKTTPENKLVKDFIKLIKKNEQAS
jgi:(E)-4-hydroxy-3-methylbut-2-enyl-diphosphate synthase